MDAAVIALQRQEAAVNAYWRHALRQRDAQWLSHLQTEVARGVAEALLSQGVRFAEAWHEARLAAFGDQGTEIIEGGRSIPIPDPDGSTGGGAPRGALSGSGSALRMAQGRF